MRSGNRGDLGDDLGDGAGGGLGRESLADRTPSGLADGPHVLVVWAIDHAGALDRDPARRSWTVDTVPPAAPTVNSLLTKRFSKKQSMQWTPEGAHLLLQIRARTLNGELAATFRTWYPAFSLKDQPAADNLLAA